MVLDSSDLGNSQSFDSSDIGLKHATVFDKHQNRDSKRFAATEKQNLEKAVLHGKLKGGQSVSIHVGSSAKKVKSEQSEQTNDFDERFSFDVDAPGERNRTQNPQSS